MGAGEWYAEKREAESAYDNDKEAAKRMAKAHGYNIEELINIVS